MGKNTIETQGRIFMGDHGSKLVVPENPIERQAKKLKEEKDAEKARELLLEAKKAKQKEINEKLKELEMLPVGNKVLISPYPENPYKKVIEGNIIVDFDESIFKNPDTGEWDKNDRLVGCAKVIEVGPDCKWLKAGDDVYYDTRTVYPVPFMSLGYKLTHEPGVLTFINTKLKDRIDGN